MKAILKIGDKEIEVEVSEEQIEKMTEKKENPFARRMCEEVYYSILASGALLKTTEKYFQMDKDLFNSANYCADRDLIQQQAYRETLNRLLWRWQYENDSFIDWQDVNSEKHHIYFRKNPCTFSVSHAYSHKGMDVYFSTEEKAEQAIEDVIKPFMKEHPDFVW